MEYQEILRRRRMVRRFEDRPVDDDQVERIVRAALRAPSAGFTQGVEVLVLHAPEDRERFWRCNRQNPQPEEVRRGGLVVVPFASKDAYLDRYAEPDKGWTDRDERRWPVLRDEFGIPDDQEPIGAIVIGHRLPDPPSPRIEQRRRDTEARVHHGNWSTVP